MSVQTLHHLQFNSCFISVPRLQLCVILEPMQELMSRHKTYSLSPRDCLKTCLFQKWQRMVAPPGNADAPHGFINERSLDICVRAPLSPDLTAEPSRQAPNKRRKRKMSGGSTISGGGGANNNNNNKKKSPGSGFPLSSQVPVSTTLPSTVNDGLLQIYEHCLAVCTTLIKFQFCQQR